ncbi:hypothetical protein BGX26_003795, partial [Mortierella sp. AD094]
VINISTTISSTMGPEEVPGEEHASLQSSVRHFELSNRELAADAYKKLIDSEDIRMNRREKLKTSFEYFQTR